MKVFAIASLLALASAMPESKGCKPGTNACTANNHGWQVCDTSGQWVFAGDCPPKTICKFYPPSQSPYCVPANFQFP